MSEETYAFSEQGMKTLVEELQFLKTRVRNLQSRIDETSDLEEPGKFHRFPDTDLILLVQIVNRSDYDDAGDSAQLRNSNFDKLVDHRARTGTWSFYPDHNHGVTRYPHHEISALAQVVAFERVKGTTRVTKELIRVFDPLGQSYLQAGDRIHVWKNRKSNHWEVLRPYIPPHPVPVQLVNDMVDTSEVGRTFNVPTGVGTLSSATYDEAFPHMNLDLLRDQNVADPFGKFLCGSQYQARAIVGRAGDDISDSQFVDQYTRSRDVQLTPGQIEEWRETRTIGQYVEPVSNFYEYEQHIVIDPTGAFANAQEGSMGYAWPIPPNIFYKFWKPKVLDTEEQERRNTDLISTPQEVKNMVIPKFYLAQQLQVRSNRFTLQFNEPASPAHLLSGETPYLPITKNITFGHGYHSTRRLNAAANYGDMATIQSDSDDPNSQPVYADVRTITAKDYPDHKVEPGSQTQFGHAMIGIPANTGIFIWNPLRLHIAFAAMVTVRWQSFNSRPFVFGARESGLSPKHGRWVIENVGALDHVHQQLHYHGTPRKPEPEYEMLGVPPHRHLVWDPIEEFADEVREEIRGTEIDKDLTWWEDVETQLQRPRDRD